MKRDDDWYVKRVSIKPDSNRKGTNSNAYKKSSSYNLKNNTGSNNTGSHEVVIKITGNSTNLQHLKRHVEYIGKENAADIINDLGEEFSKDPDKAHEYLINSTDEIKERGFYEREKRETINFVFSMNKVTGATKEDMIESTINTLQEKYPNAPYLIAFHEDTENNHCHVILRTMDRENKRINPNLNDLSKMRRVFAKNLNDRGIKALATDYIKKINLKKIEQEQSLSVVDFGKANYQFRMNGKESFFVKYKTKGGKGEEVVLWGKGLEKAIKDSDIKINDLVRIKRIKNNDSVVKSNEWNISVVSKSKNVNKESAFMKAKKEVLKDKNLKHEKEKDI